MPCRPKRLGVGVAPFSAAFEQTGTEVGGQVAAIAALAQDGSQIDAVDLPGGGSVTQVGRG